jgi:hypothetical protein
LNRRDRVGKRELGDLAPDLHREFTAFPHPRSCASPWAKPPKYRNRDLL